MAKLTVESHVQTHRDLAGQMNKLTSLVDAEFDGLYFQQP